MRRPGLVVLLLVVLVAFPIVAFDVLEVSGFDLTVLIADRIGEPVDLDPAWAYDTASAELLINVYDRLLGLNRTDMTTYIPRLATAWSFQTIDEVGPEGLSWKGRVTFQIRPGVFFQSDGGNNIPGEGALLTTDDVEYTFERFLVTDAGTGPAWIMWEALFSVGGWVGDLSDQLTALGFPINATTGWNTKTDEAIDHAIENNATYVWFNLVNCSNYVGGYEPFLQILSQSFGSIMNQAWCVWHGDWPGMQVGDSWASYHDPGTSALYATDPHSPGPHLDCALGTGPYMLDYWNRGAGNAWSIIKNLDYWEGWAVPFRHEGWGASEPAINGHVDRYTSYYIPEWNARKLRFLAGASDFCEVPRNNMSEVLGEPGIRCIFPLPRLTCNAFFFNFLISTASTHLGVVQPNSTFNQYGAPPNIMNDTNFRLAIAHLFNYTAYLRSVFSNEAMSPVTPIIPGLTYHNASIGQIENPFLDQRKKYGITGEAAGQLAFDLALAKTYLMAAWGGALWTNGFTMDAVYNEGNLARQTAAQLTKDAFDYMNANFGTEFHINLVSIPWSVYRLEWRARSLPFFILGWLADHPDAHNLAQPFMHSTGAFSRWQGFKGVTGFPNQAFDDHVAAGIATVDPVQRQGNYSWLQQNYVDFCPSFVTDQATDRHFERDWVRGWYYNRAILSYYMGNYVYDLWMEFAGPDFHDVGIYAAKVTPSLVYVGDNNVSVSVDAGNSGCFPETFNVTVYADADSSVIGDETIVGVQLVSLGIRSFTTINFTWNTTSCAVGNYTISAYAWPVTGESQTEDNLLSDATVQIIPVHDVAVTGVVPFQTVVVQGSLLDMNVTVINLGSCSEIFNVTVYANGSEVGLQEATLTIGETASLIFTWNTTGVASSNYSLSAYAWPVPYETSTDDNTCSNGVVQIVLSLMHDIAITSVMPFREVVGLGFSLDIDVGVADLGGYEETFNLTVRANEIDIGWQNVTLDTGGSATVTINWNTTNAIPGDYVISAYAWPVAGENSTDDNLCYDGTVRVRLPIHDIAVSDFENPSSVVAQGFALEMGAMVVNLGDFGESFNLTIRANGTDIDWQNVTLEAGSSTAVTLTWNTTGVVPGIYVMSAYAWPVAGETSTGDNTFSDGTVLVELPVHDVAISNITPRKTVVELGRSVSVDVTAENKGNFLETFGVTIHFGTAASETKEITLEAEGSAILTFVWNTIGAPTGEYQLWAEASVLPMEPHTVDNTLVDGVISVVQLGPSEIYMVPSNCTFDALTAPVGTLFNVTVKVNNVGDMKVWQIRMSFNDSIVNVTRWYEPKWDPTYVFYGRTTLPVPAPPNVYYVPGQGYQQGYAGCGAAIFPAPSIDDGFTGNGTLCIITFMIMAIPPLGQTYSSVLDITWAQYTFWIKAGESAKRAFDKYENGHYELTLSGPGFHDVGTTNVSASPGFVYIGENDVTISVDAWNSGYYPETFNVTVYADPNSTVSGDEILVDSRLLSIQTQGFVTLTFTWNTEGVSPGNYTISAVASNVPEEADLTNNMCVGGEIQVFAIVPCYDVNVTCPSTVTVNPSIFTYDPAYQTRLIDIGNVSIVSTGFEGALRVLGSSNGTIRLCVSQPNTDLYNFYLLQNEEVQIPLWLMFQPETHWETYNGDFTLDLTVCGTHRRQLHVVGISIVVCQNGAYVVNNETVTFTWTLTGGSLVYLEAEANLPPGWTYTVDPPEGALFETPQVVTVNITAPPDAREGDMGYVTLRAYKNATGAMFWQFIYFASTDNNPPTIEAVHTPTLTLAGDLMFNTTLKDGSGISHVQLWYSVDGGPWSNQTMQWGSGDTFNSTLYTSTVPRLPDNSVVRYYVEAEDWLGNKTQSDVQTLTVKYDLAVTEVNTDRTTVEKGFPVHVEVTVANLGTLTSPSVRIAVYANKTFIRSYTVQLLMEGTVTTLEFDWNTTGFLAGNYLVTAYVIPMMGETRTEDNAKASAVALAVLGDVTGDFWVDMQDISIMIDNFMATPPNWNPNCDVNNDLSIDMADISIAIDHFMQT